MKPTPYHPWPCPLGCPGGVARYYAYTTALNFHIRVYLVAHYGAVPSYTLICGRGWTEAEAKADGREKVTDWMAGQANHCAKELAA